MTPLLSSALLRTQSDERLVALVAAGHDRAFETVVDRYRRPLQRHVRRFLPDARAEDVVQATFVKAWAALREGTDVRDLRPWLYRIATNGALNALKRAGADDRPLPEAVEAQGGADPFSEVERRDAARRALHGLAGLPPRQRTALVATALAGRPHSEVAAELGMTDGALRQLVHRARRQLRAVATAVTPPPLLGGLAASHELTAARVAEVAAGAGGAGLAATSLKAGAVALSAGALVAGAPHVAKVAEHAAAPRAAHAIAPPTAKRVAAQPVVAAAAPIAATRPAVVVAAVAVERQPVTAAARVARRHADRHRGQEAGRRSEATHSDGSSRGPSHASAPARSGPSHARDGESSARSPSRGRAEPRRERGRTSPDGDVAGTRAKAPEPRHAEADDHGGAGAGAPGVAREGTRSRVRPAPETEVQPETAHEAAPRQRLAEAAVVSAQAPADAEGGSSGGGERSGSGSGPDNATSAGAGRDG